MVLGNLTVGRSVMCHQCFDNSAGDHWGPPVRGRRWKIWQRLIASALVAQAKAYYAVLLQGNSFMSFPLETRNSAFLRWQMLKHARIVQSCHYLGVVLFTAPFLKIKALSGKCCNTSLKRHYFQLKISYVPNQNHESEIKSDTFSPVVSLAKGKEGSFSSGPDVQDATRAVIPDNFNLNLSPHVNGVDL